MALLKDLIVQGASRFIGDAYFNNIKSGTFYGNLAEGTKGTLFYQSAANTTTTLAIGTEGQVLKVGSSGVPVWGSDSNSDTKVTQTVTTSSNSSWRPVIVGYSSNDSTTFSPSTVTNTVYATHLAKFAPSTGILAVVGLNKMNTNGAVATGSNDIVFNTNGTTTTLGSNAYTSTAYLPLAGGTMSNTNLVGNMNADLLDGYEANTITNIYHGAWCSGEGEYYGKVAEFKYNSSNTVDLSATFLISRYATSGNGAVNILNIRGRGNSKTDVTCTATWSLNTNNSVPITITHIYNSSDGYYYIRIYFQSNGWDETYGCKLLNSHAWNVSNMTRWTLYNGMRSSSTTIEKFTEIPSGETVIPITTITINNNAASATNATNDANGSKIDTTYLKLAGGTMTGALTTPSLTVTGASSFSQAINGSILGNAATASRWQNARTLTLTGAVTGSVSIDGSANVSLTTTVNHNHDDRYYTETESDSRYLKLAGGWMDTDAQIDFKGYNSSTSVYAGIGYFASLGGNRYHLGGDTYNTKGLYIYTNGYNASNDWGGLAIDNDGVTAFGAGDTGSVFRVVNEDNADQGAQFAVQKENGAYVRNNLTVGTQSVDTNSKLAVIGNVRITNSTSNTGCKMEYNATEECLEFNF